MITQYFKPAPMSAEEIADDIIKKLELEFDPYTGKALIYRAELIEAVKLSSSHPQHPSGTLWVEVPVSEGLPKISSYYLCTVIPSGNNLRTTAEVFYNKEFERFSISPNDGFSKVISWLERQHPSEREGNN